MRSFILEYIKRKREDIEKSEVVVDLHVNLWAFQNKKIIFDFGFMIDEINLVDEIILYTPFVIDKVEDLGEKIRHADILAEAIFNERCEVTINFQPKRIKIIKKGKYDFDSLSKEGDPFIFYLLDSKQIEVINDESETYSKIKIDTKDIIAGSMENICPKYYFRIRFSPAGENIDMIKYENEKINILQDASLRTTEIIDFRINDLRACSDSLREEFLRRDRFKIRKIHYFIIRNSTDEFVGVDSSNVESRILEKEIWKNYIRVDENDMIAYHVKKENKEGDINSFSNLSRFKYPLNVAKRMLLYLFVVMIISFLASCLADFVKIK